MDPGLVAFYDIRPRNETGLFLSTRSPGAEARTRLPFNFGTQTHVYYNAPVTFCIPFLCFVYYMIIIFNIVKAVHDDEVRRSEN